MAQNSNSIVYKNVLAWRGSEKLYLNSRTCDVHFVFPSVFDESGKIPAHKCILAATSPAFDAMFYGAHRQQGDITITDATPDAFKEFLQFFYRSQVILTTENVPEVMNLGKQYLVDDCLSACADLCEQTLTLDNMCRGYELAILFEVDDLKKFCENTISEKAAEIFQTDGFLQCGPNLLRHILLLDSLKCDEAIIFDGCIAWAKAACIRKQVDDRDMQNIRSQLGELFYDIRFGEMSNKDFQQRYRLHDGLFSLEEYKDINMMIACQEFQPEKFNRSARSASESGCKQNTCVEEMVFKRSQSQFRHDPRQCISSEDPSTFTSTHYLRLKEVIIRLEILPRTVADTLITEFPIEISIFEGYTVKLGGLLLSHFETICKCSSDEVLELPKPILIKPGVKYVVEMNYSGCVVRGVRYNKLVRLQLAEIRFEPEYSFLAGLVAERLEKPIPLIHSANMEF